MKKNSTKNTTTTPHSPTLDERVAATLNAKYVETPEVAPTTEPQQEQKPDFYARLLTERPNEAASIMATLNRRKDFALRQLSAHLKAGRNVQEALAHAMAIAFPKHQPQQAAP